MDQRFRHWPVDMRAAVGLFDISDFCLCRNKLLLEVLFRKTISCRIDEKEFVFGKTNMPFLTHIGPLIA